MTHLHLGGTPKQVSFYTTRRDATAPRGGHVVMIGVDAHKRTHTLVAVDEIGRKMGELTVQATTDGHLKAVQWARQWQSVSFAVEDCRHMTRRLERDLLAAGFRVIRVHTRFMATARRAGRQPGKSDPIDALAVAHAAQREPSWQHSVNCHRSALRSPHPKTR